MLRQGSEPHQPNLWEDSSELDLKNTAVEEGQGLLALDQVDWSFANSTERGLTHGLHPWPARFIPDIPAAAIAQLTRPGDVVLDPFCGCGTTALEALRTGRGYIAGDVNPLAVRITEGKCEPPDPRARMTIYEWSRQLVTKEPTDELLDMAPEIPNIRYWFDGPVIAQLSYILHEIRALNVATSFLETVFSSIIVGVSHQESDTRYRRVEREVTADETLSRFRKRLFRALEMAATLDAVRRADEARNYLVLDARDIGQALPVGCAQLAVFSPPYPNSFDYHLYHRFRMFWLGMDPRPIKHAEIGAHLRYQPDHVDWLEDMRRTFMGLLHCLVPGGHIVCVVGDGVIRGRLVPSGDLLWTSAPEWGPNLFGARPATWPDTGKPSTYPTPVLLRNRY